MNVRPTAETVSIVALADQLPIRLRPARRLSDDALFELCQRNRDLKIERTSNGEIVVARPAGGETGRRNFELIGQLGAWVHRDGTGVGFDSSTGFLLPNGAERSPDMAWVKRSRWAELSAIQRKRFVPLCPDFVMELKSPSESIDELKAKMVEYQRCGAALGWLIDPDAARVWVYRPGHRPRLFRRPRTLAGDPVLRGLVIDLQPIWK